MSLCISGLLKPEWVENNNHSTVPWSGHLWWPWPLLHAKRQWDISSETWAGPRTPGLCLSVGILGASHTQQSGQEVLGTARSHVRSSGYGGVSRPQSVCHDYSSSGDQVLATLPPMPKPAVLEDRAVASFTAPGLPLAPQCPCGQVHVTQCVLRA
jgi:hypothetical protein